MLVTVFNCSLRININYYYYYHHHEQDGCHSDKTFQLFLCSLSILFYLEFYFMNKYSILTIFFVLGGFAFCLFSRGERNNTSVVMLVHVCPCTETLQCCNFGRCANLSVRGGGARLTYFWPDRRRSMHGRRVNHVIGNVMNIHTNTFKKEKKWEKKKV